MPFARLNLLGRWRARRELKVKIEHIHGEIVAAARTPELYVAFSAPDDLDGRFEMVTLHAGILLRRLNDFGEPGRDLAQEIVDRLFVGFDDALREMSISDAGVKRRVRSFAEAFFGRSAVYHAALAAGSVRALAEALARNIYRGGLGAEALAPRLLAERVFQLVTAFEAMDLAAILDSGFRFPNAHGGPK